jgi:hypothetical protein
MENANQEIAAIQQAVIDAADECIQQLDALQLTMVGGGIADTILA